MTAWIGSCFQFDLFRERTLTEGSGITVML